GQKTVVEQVGGRFARFGKRPDREGKNVVAVIGLSFGEKQFHAGKTMTEHPTPDQITSMPADQCGSSCKPRLPRACPRTIGGQALGSFSLPSNLWCGRAS